MAALALPGCALDGLSFVTDERVDIVAPADRGEVRLPVTVDWTARDVGNRVFGVFVDRAPPPPGKTPGWLFRGDAVCKGRGRARCETPEFLETRQVFFTEETELAIARIDRLGDDDKRRELHEVTVVLLDRDRVRVNESAWSVQFSVEGER